MADTFDSLNDYVPVQSSSGLNEMLIPQIIFRDQMTVARIRGAAILRSSDLVIPKQRNQFIGAVSDWHARLYLVMVCILYLQFLSCVLFTL